MDHHSHEPPKLVRPLLAVTLPPALLAGAALLIARPGWSFVVVAVANVLVVALIGYALVGYAMTVQRNSDWKRRSGQIDALPHERCPECLAAVARSALPDVDRRPPSAAMAASRPSG